MEERTFPGPGPSNNSDFFPRLRVHREIFEGEREVFPVPEVDVLELDDALGRPVVGRRPRPAVQVLLGYIPRLYI